MKTSFIDDGKTIKVTEETLSNVSNKLKANIYELNVEVGMFGKSVCLKTVNDFDIKFKLYGDTVKLTERILKTYRERLKIKNTGVLLTGKKGTGKTILAKNIAKEGLKLEIPTIIIKEKTDPSILCSFLKMIKDPAIIIFDEFEKMYKDNNEDSDGEQSDLLSIFDGLVTSNKLFILTCNNTFRINNMLFSRPGRMYYHLNFESIDDKLIEEYCNDNLKNKKYIQNIVTISNIFGSFTIDILKSLVEEMNRYNESPFEAIKYLNIVIENELPYYNVCVYKNKKLIFKEKARVENIENIEHSFYLDSEDERIDISSSDISKITKDKILFNKIDDKYDVIYEKINNKSVDISEELIF